MTYPMGFIRWDGFEPTGLLDGRLTAEEALQRWNLHCELVTLSACQTALGKYERGEGFVGFAQALVLCGTRAVCLSLWKVNDTATALLMERFYQNLLGKREGLKAPLPKAAKLPPLNVPLDEAKAKPEDCPFAHPYYWVAFVLVGDPQ
jgi:CHAT domain-containing protein